MMKILITGAYGFIGRNLIAHLHDQDVVQIGSTNPPEELRNGLETADVVYHLAGVNRPKTVKEFETVNVGLTQTICQVLKSRHIEGRGTPRIVFTSSIQAVSSNAYGISKRHAEEALRTFADETGADVRIFQLKNVFGKWSRPYYNSVVATFCQNVANGLPVQVADPVRKLELAYIDDVVAALIGASLDLPFSAPSDIPFTTITLGDLADRIQTFRDVKTSLIIPDFRIPFNQQLYATYLSYIPDAARRLQLDIKSDPRGELAEFVKSKSFGQMFVSRTRPGITRGNHYHHTKTEKFFVVEGEGIVRMRRIDSLDVVEYRVHGGDFQVIDIPPGFTHSITNVGPTDLITLFWASEIFDANRPDTEFVEVGPWLGPEADYSSHRSLLTTIGQSHPVTSVLELGSGMYSTPLFLNKEIYPNVRKVVSIEHNQMWADKVRALCLDDRLSLLVMPEPVEDYLETLNLKDFDLIFVDNSELGERRAATIRYLGNKCTTSLVVVHDFEALSYQEAAANFTHRTVDTDHKPHTALLWKEG